MLNPAKKATCRTFLCALAFASLASGQVVERGRTLADLIQSHPCDTGLTNRIARVTDCDAADDFGNGGGAFQCWAYCDGSAPWTNLSIGGGAGGGLSDSDYGDVAVSGSGTAMTVEALRGGAVAVAATTGNLQWEGTTADAFEGNFTFADPTADWTWAWGADGTLTGPLGGVVIGPASATDNGVARFDGTTGKLIQGGAVLSVDDGGNVAVKSGGGYFDSLLNSGVYFPSTSTLTLYAGIFDNILSVRKIGTGDFRLSLDEGTKLAWIASGVSETGTIDTTMERAAAGIVKVTSVLQLTPLASPPATCDAGLEGAIYQDTSHVTCVCDGSTWNVLTGSGAGSCA